MKCSLTIIQEHTASRRCTQEKKCGEVRKKCRKLQTHALRCNLRPRMLCLWQERKRPRTYPKGVGDSWAFPARERVHEHHACHKDSTLAVKFQGPFAAPKKNLVKYAAPHSPGARRSGRQQERRSACPAMGSCSFPGSGLVVDPAARAEVAPINKRWVAGAEEDNVLVSDSC